MANDVNGLSDGQKLFLRNELRAMYAGRWTKKLTLPLFVFLAMFGVAFASAGLSYLAFKMDDPYVKWLDLPVTTGLQKSPKLYQNALDSLTKWSDENAYFLSDQQGYFRYPLNFYGKEVDREFVVGRTVDAARDTNLLNSIFENQMVLDFRDSLMAETHRNAVDLWRDGIVMTESLYRELYGRQSPRRAAVYRGESLTPIVNILAVVRRLPSRAHFLSSPEFHWSISGNDPNFQHNSRIDSLVLYLAIPSESDLPTELPGLLRDSLTLDSLDLPALRTVSLHPVQTRTVGHDIRLRIELEEPQNLQARRRLFKQLKKRDNGLGLDQCRPLMASRYRYLRAQDFQSPETQRGGTEDMFHWISLQFDRLDSIRTFSNRLGRDLEIELNLNKVESLENYNIVGILTRVLGLLLSLFAMSCVVIFVSNLVNGHLESIKANLGTFRAFGISKRFLIRMYAFIVATIVGVSILVSGVLLSFLSAIGLFQSIIAALRFDAGMDLHSMSVTDPWVFTMIVLLFISATLTSVWSTQRILQQSPGDLIYNRTDQSLEDQVNAVSLAWFPALPRFRFTRTHLILLVGGSAIAGALYLVPQIAPPPPPKPVVPQVVLQDTVAAKAIEQHIAVQSQSTQTTTAKDSLRLESNLKDLSERIERSEVKDLTAPQFLEDYRVFVEGVETDCDTLEYKAWRMKLGQDPIILAWKKENPDFKSQSRALSLRLREARRACQSGS